MARKPPSSYTSRQRGWTYLTNHALVLRCLADDPYIRLLDIAERVGITDRAVQKIIADLEEDGVIERMKEGRCNHYVIAFDHVLRHPLESATTVGDLLGRLQTAPETASITVGLGRDG